MKHLAAIAAAALLSACSTASGLSGAEADGMSEDQLCRQMALWRNYQGTIYQGLLGRFPVAAFGELVSRHPDWKAKVPNDLRGWPSFGTSTSEVWCFWPPKDVNASVLRGGHTFEQWIYGGHWRGSFLGFAPATYLYFENGELESIQYD